MRRIVPSGTLIIEIAAKLWVYGEHVIELDPLPTQRLVDLQWAARQAGRVLGGRAKIKVSKSPAAQDRLVTVTITYVDADDRSLQRAEEAWRT